MVDEKVKFTLSGEMEIKVELGEIAEALLKLSVEDFRVFFWDIIERNQGFWDDLTQIEMRDLSCTAYWGEEGIKVNFCVGPESVFGEFSKTVDVMNDVMDDVSDLTIWDVIRDPKDKKKLKKRVASMKSAVKHIQESIAEIEKYLKDPKAWEDMMTKDLLDGEK